MKFLNVIIMFLIAFSLSGIALYAVGPNLSTEAVVQNAMKQLEESGKMEEMVQQIEADPKVYEYMNQLETQMEQPADAEDEADEQAVGAMDDEYSDVEVEQPEVPAQEELAFDTKEDAASVMMEKVGFRNLLKMKNAVENDTMTAEQVMGELDEDLNEEEMLALKVMIFQEWQNRK